eukprot:739877-Hanusia_phi.AAC.5
MSRRACVSSSTCRHSWKGHSTMQGRETRRHRHRHLETEMKARRQRGRDRARKMIKCQTFTETSSKRGICCENGKRDLHTGKRFLTFLRGEGDCGLEKYSSLRHPSVQDFTESKLNDNEHEVIPESFRSEVGSTSQLVSKMKMATTPGWWRDS